MKLVIIGVVGYGVMIGLFYWWIVRKAVLIKEAEDDLCSKEMAECSKCKEC